jgi:hypothetical protein
MKKILFVLPVLVLTLLLGGCADLFDFNLFQPLEVISLPTQEKLESMDPADALAYLGRELTSRTFIEKMQANPGARAEVEAFLQTKTGIEPVTRRGVADPLAAEWLWTAYNWFLKVYHGNEMVNHIVTLLTGGQFEEAAFQTSDDTYQFVKNFFTSIIGEEVLKDQTGKTFYDMFDGVQAAWQACVAIVGRFDEEAGDQGDWPQDYNGEPFNIGDFLQGSLVLWLVDTAVYSGAIWSNPDKAKEALWNIVNLRPDKVEAPDGNFGLFENPFEPDGVFDRILGQIGLDLFGETT